MVALALAAVGCVDLGDHPRTGIAGRMTTGPGVVFLERGHVQMGTFERGGVIDADGRFAVDLPPGAAGPWGVHLYITGYFYLPLEVEVLEGFTTRVEQLDIAWDIVRSGPAWGESGMQPVEPGVLAPIPDKDESDNPTIDDLQVRPLGGGAFQATMNVADPKGELSRQALVLNLATGTGVQMNAPGPAVDDKFPNGEYRATLYLPAEADPHAPWYFVAANHGCSNSPVREVTPP